MQQFETTPNLIELMPYPQIYVERTLVIVKPDAMPKVNEIEHIILNNGFTILAKRRVHMSPEQASEFYIEHYGKMFFPSLVAYMSSAPVQVYCLAKAKAISSWNQIMGSSNPFKAREMNPGSLRDTYGRDLMRNGVHGSDSFTSAHREIRFMFPNSIIEPICVGQAARDYLSKEVSPTLLNGLTSLCKEKPCDPVTWLADWLTENNPNKPQVKNPIIDLA